MYCRVCGGLIDDWGVLQSQGLNPPKLCEPCRHRVRAYRPSTAVRHELVFARVVRVGQSAIDALRHQHEAEGCIPGVTTSVYALGGPYFGPHGGASFGDKYLVYFRGIAPAAGQCALLRVMNKVLVDTGRAWTYLVLEPCDDETNLELAFKFVRVYKTTIKGYGRQYDDAYPVEEPHEVILSGWSSARSGRYGNEWVLYVREVGR